MNRFRYLLLDGSKHQLIGIFPYGLIIDDKKSNHKTNEIHFFDDGINFLKMLAQKNISIVMFINQFKPALPFEKFESFVEAVESFSKQQGVNLKGVYWCPGTDKRDPFVIPNPGMFHRVTENTGITWDNIPVISNNELDLVAASKVNAVPIKIGGNSTKWTRFSSLNEWFESQTN